MRKQFKEKKTERLTMRVSKSEKNAIIKEANLAGLDITTYLINKRQAKTIVHLADCRRLADEVYHLNQALSAIDAKSINTNTLTNIVSNGIADVAKLIKNMEGNDNNGDTKVCE
ncbi:plasmid mobilization protein [Pectinatus haikarae]|uniref:Uncharacterized protein (DUF1778 family) n=1 Tax=Pectinatus haikarae TaxID=349096 RepID=A0ABT9Y5D7_9FIRM|nr:hypothetical protein [Pectinatus haikarae]MDQ0202843.1 uncharacterized protein (DUF1778 family) [Pectinatus haikarae]